jgi:hypothetical protein
VQHCCSGHRYSSQGIGSCRSCALCLGRGLTLRCTPTRYGWLRQPSHAGELKR